MPAPEGWTLQCVGLKPSPRNVRILLTGGMSSIYNSMSANLVRGQTSCESGAVLGNFNEWIEGRGICSVRGFWTAHVSFHGILGAARPLSLNQYSTLYHPLEKPNMLGQHIVGILFGFACTLQAAAQTSSSCVNDCAAQGLSASGCTAL
jgi:hypothetical protein